MQSLLVSLSLLAGTAAPALAREAPVAARVARQLDRLDAEEQRALAAHDARLDALERARLERYLSRHGIAGRQAARERARLAEKQRLRHAENVAFLEAKQRVRGAQNLADATHRDDDGPRRRGRRG
jgi:hypothetical protein